MFYSPPQDPYLTILKKTVNYLIVDKQSGILTVPGRGPDKADCLFKRVIERHPEALVVHRLDLETSGLVLFALNKMSQSHFGRLFQARKIDKTYHAIVDGIVNDYSGRIELPLAADWPNRPKQMVSIEHGKPSITNWRLVRHDNQYSYLELKPETGRSHQLRVHLAAIGHPILGDPLYNPKHVNPRVNRLMLHASCLKFEIPASKKTTAEYSQIPFKGFLKA